MRLLKLASVAAFLTVSSAAFGQSCVADGAFSDATTSASGDMCADASDQLAASCSNGTTFAAGPDVIYEVPLGATSSAVFSATGTGFTAYLGLMASTCNSNSTCNGYEAIASGSGAAATLASTSGLAAGTYYLVLTDIIATIDCSTAGTVIPFDVSYAGTLPVELKNFSIN